MLIGIVQRPVGDADPTLVPILPARDVARIETFVWAYRSLRASQRVGAVFDWLVEEFDRWGWPVDVAWGFEAN